MTNPTNSPSHIAIIMDGNGRWAKERGLKRTAGHEEGAKVVREITTHCSDLGIKYLTLYAFSTENWTRPKIEVEFLMKLLERYFKSELAIYLENNVKFKAIGDLSKFSKKLQKVIQDTQEKTQHCTGLTQILALNYGSRDEITRAIKKVNEQNLEITEENINNNLDTAGIDDVDILIRTSGEVRVSNYMLWQIAYAEMFFTKSYWPEFTKIELDDILSDFKKRERRFGGI
ncbi:MAG: di-trans,poly-cis-decaprenylcistransferase [Campylobacteraceae bacterium]|jgi:undecaprenyl diphosphate synthase|nr:di-trans,poly-cis-decaprenylcistransferase [Campylobacteraceae bacterium]MBT3881747.1 di-trans,poly-cis-decaprenylcistransferase [Campylobacteraceae bacterium]MBT4030456.1 di-trans,poly-cis-decaprenylcistransferase [Campylobacteraceae bacterium]MBT4178949.1 di-trans,poly-cis-decaprenylcistransferase [Campylobacteraceae bacterium]MBT4573052.1 di-trans,poly-cis-decaprenylcistransferase [Campylobacteraceae bacterium]